MVGGTLTGWTAKGLWRDDPCDRTPRIPAVIEREQVLHVAKLARLRLSDDEMERMAGELSGILDHVDRIGELDLGDVEPTSHVVELENVLRPDEPRPSWPRDVVLEQAPDPADGAFRVPSPQADS
jgi:aspartyl-tRNA(Asn)/glutamyl-tRNA(Gln) amidotransferase subunit C